MGIGFSLLRSVFTGIIADIEAIAAISLPRAAQSS
jgi:hypothetical protein